MSKHPTFGTGSRTLCALLVMLLLNSLTFANCVLPPPNQLVRETLYNVPTQTGSWGVVVLENVPAGYTVANTLPSPPGIYYLSWCVNAVASIVPGPPGYDASLYDTSDPGDLAALGVLGVPVGSNQWNKINYILNHKGTANATTLQAAIWRITNPPAAPQEPSMIAGTYLSAPPESFPAADLNQINALVAAANANPTFAPGPGQVTAVYLYVPGTQPLVIEVICPVLGSIGDTVFCDYNENGTQDSGEPGIQGVKVSISCVTATGTFTSMAVTGQNGKYLFEGLQPGICTVTVDPTTAPPDCNRIIPNCPLSRTVNLAAGQTFLEADFCFAPSLGRIGDTVFCDLNKNGVQDPGDVGIPNVKVNLTCLPLAGGTFTSFALTDINGKYLFTNLQPGTCTVTVDKTTLPPTCNVDVPGCPSTITVNLAPGQVYLEADFCFTPPLCTLDVAAFCSIPQPAGDGNDCDGSKIKSIKMLYTAENCSASFNIQPPDKTSCSGVSALDNNVWIKVTDKSSPTDTRAKVWFQGFVAKDATYNILASAAGATALSADSYIYIYKTNKTTLLQTVKFHTSCSQPIAAGNQFGANLIVEMKFADGRTTTLITPQLDENCEITLADAKICPPGVGNKIKSLQLIYTAEGCGSSSNSQPSDKWYCTSFGTLPVAGTVYIRVSDKENPTDSRAKVWFKGPVPVDGAFTAAAANAGATTLSTDTYVHVFASQGGALLQRVKFHTSCSQPLNAGDQFGSIVVFSANTTVGGVISLGAEVKFTYLVSNTGTSPITNVVVTDSFGTVPGSPIATIAPSQVVQLTRTVTTSTSIANTVTVASQQGGCQDTDITTVTIVPPPPTPKDCTAAIQKTLLKYTGPNVNGAVTVSFLGSSGATASYSFPGGLLSGTTLSLPSQNNWTIDSTVSGQTALGSKMTISINGVPEVHHTSCSTPYRTGLPAPLDNPKGQPSTLWFVVDFVSKP